MITPPHSNLLFAWLWICLGFVSGLGLGWRFHREDWLGGYGSFKRRLLRLAHISFFGLGVVNLCFYFTARGAALCAPYLAVASWAFIIGGVSMPVCCLVMAYFPKSRMLFSLPVLSLILAGATTVVALAHPGPADANPGAASVPQQPAVSGNF